MKIVALYFENIDLFLEHCGNHPSDYVLLVASNTQLDLKKFNHVNVNVYGALFPQIIFNKTLYDTGLIAIEINSSMNVHFIKSMQENSLLERNFQNVKSVIAVIEGLSQHSEEFLQELFEKIDIDTNIIGGGAGVKGETSKAVIFDKEKFYHDGAILIALIHNITLGVQHGWSYLQGPFIVTESEKNIVKKIDYKPAFEVYKEVIEKDCGIEINEQNVADVLNNYPLGVLKYEGEQIVREPISVSNGELVLVGNITNNALVNVLKGKNRHLLNAVKVASNDALKENCELVIVFDCTTRENFLEEKFEEELDIIFKKAKSSTLIGAVTLGEIANDGNRYIHFLNKTCVIGGICF
ncbi:MAG: FIST C-terminal domain-containing protein [Candidatus Marinarcus sp.]|uniref:FIST C-terminal domain-containing protein n=1 Tax=Candidatus Marinarcus sp. TaxID=3100987 RepID=UPI003AFF9911